MEGGWKVGGREATGKELGGTDSGRRSDARMGMDGMGNEVGTAVGVLDLALVYVTLGLDGLLSPRFTQLRRSDFLISF